MNKALYVLAAFLYVFSNTDACTASCTDSLSVFADSLVSAREDSLAEIVFQADIHDTTEAMHWHQMFTRIPEDYYQFFKTSFSSSALTTAAGLAALTGIFMIIDKPVGTWSHSLVHKSAGYSRLAGFMVETGDGKYHFLLAGALSLYGLSAGDTRALRTASNLAEGILVSGIAVQLLKRITGRQSPEASSFDPGEWRLFPNPLKYQKNQPKYYAFPSGHIATATLTVTVLANSYPEIKWIRPVGYALIGGLGLGLMSKGMHWISDLPLGMLLGYTFGNIVAPDMGVYGSSKDPRKSGISVVPFYSPSLCSLTLVYSF